MTTFADTRGLTEALTVDRDFEQAGFRARFKYHRGDCLD
jgi:hypothetical protein